MTIQKKCSSCLTLFECGDTAISFCWCNQYPAIFNLATTQDCLCPKCLHQATIEKIDSYVTDINKNGIENNSAAELKTSTDYIIDIDYYIENGLWVFTAWHHLKRGSCCKSGCRHCPYGFTKEKL